MIGLSSVWVSGSARSGTDLLKPILDLGFQGVELEYRITQRVYGELLPLIRSSEVRVLSIHNYFPVPEIIRSHEASGDCFSLSSLDGEERKKGIHYTTGTVEIAHDLAVGVVVLHLGTVETDMPKNGLAKLYREGNWDEMGKELLERETEERQHHRDVHLDALFFSLEQLLKRADSLGVTLGIENRYHHQEIPDMEEIGIILDKFKGAPIGYWHDTGHAAVLERLEILKHEELLRSHASTMVGVHLHDCHGVSDHKPPGQGDVDFEMVQRYLPEGVIKVMEIHPPASGEEILQGLKNLHECGIA